MNTAYIDGWTTVADVAAAAQDPDTRRLLLAFAAAHCEPERLPALLKALQAATSEEVRSSPLQSSGTPRMHTAQCFSLVNPVAHASIERCQPSHPRV